MHLGLEDSHPGIPWASGTDLPSRCGKIKPAGSAGAMREHRPPKISGHTGWPGLQFRWVRAARWSIMDGGEVASESPVHAAN